ncbi:MAG: hypothetical protein KJ604_20715, partial [Gammaproteobacteria bacterium]|nr:hypothetical protein [Gammaproteobacteria bacterium]
AKETQPQTPKERLKKKAEERKTRTQKGAIVIETAAKPFRFSDKKVDDRIEKAMAGIPSKGYAARLKEWAVDIKNQMTRTWKTLPNKKEFAIAEDEFIHWGAIPSVAGSKAQKHLHDVVGDMSIGQATLFTKAVIMEDAVETVKIAKQISPRESVKLGYELTEANLPSLHTEVMEELEKHPDIKKDVERYWEINRDIRKRTIEAAEKLDPVLADHYRKKLTREKYFHHQILSKIEDSARITGGPRGLGTRLWRGYLSRRYGSFDDPNANIIQATQRVWAQMEADIMIMESLTRIKNTYDKSPTLKAELKTIRKKVMKGLVWRGDFIDGAINTTIASNINRLWEIAKEKVEATDSGVIKLENEIRKITKETADAIDNYRSRLVNPEFVESETKRLESWTLEKIAKKLKVEIDELPDILDLDVSIPDLDFMARRFTDFQVALLNGDIPYSADFMLEKLESPHKVRGVRDVMYRAYTIGEDMARDIMENQAQGVVSAEDLREVMAKGDAIRWVIPEEIADTVDHIAHQKRQEPAFIKKAATSLKRYFLFAPQRLPRFVSNNTISDTTFMVSIAPKIALTPKLAKKYMGGAAGIVRDMRKLKEPDIDGGRKDDVDFFFSWGGESVGFVATEAKVAHRKKAFRAFQRETLPQRVGYIPADYMNAATGINTVTETHRRLALYLYALDQLRAGKKITWASNRKMLDGLATERHKAYRLANDVLIRYDATSEMGRKLGDWFLFWGFREGNFRAFANMIKNVYIDEKTAVGIGKKLLGTAGVRVGARTLYRLGVWWLRLMGLSGALTAINLLFHPEETGEMRDQVKSRPFLIFGKDKVGNI